jgi:hypothetical protein
MMTCPREKPLQAIVDFVEALHRLPERDRRAVIDQMQRVLDGWRVAFDGAHDSDSTDATRSSVYAKTQLQFSNLSPAT